MAEPGIARNVAQGRETKSPSIYPTTSTEYVNSLAHYYRGELGRMTSWRDRLDRTTNWAIAGAAAILSIALTSPNAHHGAILFAMLLVFLLLFIESRRYRFFHLYRSRVRLLERNYYARIFTPHDQVDPTPWMSQLSTDLRAPSFSITLKQAMSRRLRRNYVWIFFILLLAWLLKITMTFTPPPNDEITFIYLISEFLQNAAIGYMPGWVVISAIASLYGYMFYIMIKYRKAPGFERGRALV